MNKKLILGIVAGIAVLLAIIIAIVAVTGSFNFKKHDGNPSDKAPTSSDVASNKVDDKGNKEFTVEVEKAEKESIISVPVLIKKNPGFYAGEFLLTFDKTVLSYVDYTEGDIVDQFDVSAGDGSLKIIAYNSAYEDVKKDDTLMTLNFKVLKENADGEYKITIQKEGTMLGSFVTGEEVKADILLGKPTAK